MQWGVYVRPKCSCWEGAIVHLSSCGNDMGMSVGWEVVIVANLR